MASVLPLPNVGNTPSFKLSFSKGPDGVVRQDRAANTVSIFESFWTDAHVLQAETPSVGKLTLRYEGPTQTRSRVEQNVELRLCSSEGGPSPVPSMQSSQTGLPRADISLGQMLGRTRTSELSLREWVVSEVFQQENLEQGLRSECDLPQARTRSCA